MYNSDDTKWFSQALFFHKDKTEGTDSSIRVSISTGTADFANYSIPKLSIQIQNQLHKSVQLDLNTLRDLVIGIKENMNRQSPADGEPVIRKITWNHELSISFHFPSDPKVKIIIRSSETDFTKVIISFHQFTTILKIMEQFLNNYLQICDSLVLRSIAYQLNKLDDLNRNVRGLYGNMGTSNTEQEIIRDSSAPQQDAEIDSQSVNAMTDLSDQLDNFLGDDMENIKIPEIEEDKVTEQEEKTVTEIDSPFYNMLNNSIEQAVSMIHQSDSFDSFTSQMSAMLDMEVLPGIDDSTFKMITYFSKLFVDLSISSATQFDSSIPAGFPILKYEAKGVTKDNLNLAYDLLLTSIFLRMFRSTLENHQTDIFANMSVHHLKFRMFADPIIFSMIEGKSKEKVFSAVMSRYDYYKKIGVFEAAEKKLSSENYPEIERKEIGEYLEAILKKAESSPMFNEFYKKAIEMHKLRLPIDNNLNLEQIKNELIPLEIKEKLSNKIEKEDLSGLSDEVKELFETKKKKKTNQLNTIQMFVKKFNVEVPESIFDDLMKFLEDYADKPIDFNNFPFQVEDFEESVLKGLYYWDPEKYKNATSLKDDLDDSMTKDLILAKILSKDEEEDGDDFASALDNLEL